ncbi:hypothetical protein ABZX75_15565 [Streptomyces sp. NPDC003038]|uniref:hypothetical protein n=1 Tax=unclassified Streptomyces TaxID=2593676 RepID=UPI0033B9D0AB
MRTRTAATAAVAAAFALVLPAAGLSTAASGGFEYTFTDASGESATAVLVRPNDHVCIDLPGIGGTPATDLVNETSGIALLYGTRGCVGHPMDAVKPGQATVVRTYSVVFVPAG